MKFCQEHWKQLRKAIDDNGLGHLVAKDGEQAVKDLVEQAKLGVTPDNFDPLMFAHNIIFAKIIEHSGLTYFMPDAPHNGCPMCEPDEVNPNWATKWIDGASLDTYNYAVHIGAAKVQ